jgi:acyl-CoA synthetase (AMP-forming)/AMP-acid ligase II
MTHNTILDVLDEHAANRPETQAFNFLSGELETTACLTYEQLVFGAKRIAAKFVKEFEHGSRLIIPAHSTPDFVQTFLGCLYAGMVPIPITPRIERKLLESKSPILTESRASALITANRPENARLKAINGFQILNHDELSASPKDHALAHVRNEDLAFVQYTSGSESAPKGVRVTHKNILANMAMISKNFGHSETTPFVTWLPFYHDMGLVGTLLQPLYCGTTCSVLSPAAFLHNPGAWLRAIAQFGAYTSGGPNFAFELCVDRIELDAMKDIDLNCWKVAFNGAEPINASTARSFAQKFAPLGFKAAAMFPCYGMAEATLFISGGPVQSGLKTVTRGADIVDEAIAEETRPLEGAGSAKEIVSCGEIANGLKIAVVSPKGNVLDDGITGEIAVAGASISNGYLNRSDTEKSHIVIPDREADGLYFRTGDLGFVENGELFVEGRLKDLIIIRGRNIHPPDVEAKLRIAAEVLLPCGRIACFQDGSGRVFTAAELHRKYAREDPALLDALISLFREVCGEEFEFSLDGIYIVRSGAIPVTTSGKISRHKCRALIEAEPPVLMRKWMAADTIRDMEESSGVLPRASDASVAAGLVERAMGVPLAQVSWPLTRSGLDSISAFTLQQQMMSALKLQIPTRAIFTARSLEALLSAASEERSSHSSAAVAKELSTTDNIPLTATQKAIWIDPFKSRKYIDTAIILCARALDPIDPLKLESAIDTVISRHPLLRAKVTGEGNDLTFRLETSQHFKSYTDAEDLENCVTKLIANREWSPESLLFEAILFCSTAGQQLVVIICNHIVCDLLSMAVILDELSALLGGQTLEPVSDASVLHQYKNEQRLQSTEGKDADAFWSEVLDSPTNSLVLPADVYQKPGAASAAQVFFAIPDDISLDIQRLAEELEVSVYAILFTAYSLTIRRHSNVDSFIVATPVSSRIDQSVARAIGCFIDLAFLPVVLKPDISGSEHIHTVDHLMLGVRDNAWFGAPLLASKLRSKQTNNVAPLYSAMFTYQALPREFHERFSALALGLPDMPFELGQLQLTTTSQCKRPPLAELDMAICRLGDSYEGYLGSSGAYGVEALNAIVKSCISLLRLLVNDPSLTLASLTLASFMENEGVAAENNSDGKYKALRRIEEIFEDQANRTPHAIAIRDADGTVSYEQLNMESETLSKRIHRRLHRQL